jgi:hypothetical protein
MPSVSNALTKATPFCTFGVKLFNEERDSDLGIGEGSVYQAV